MAPPRGRAYRDDRDGIVRFVDVREDYHLWLDSQLLVDAVASL